MLNARRVASRAWTRRQQWVTKNVFGLLWKSIRALVDQRRWIRHVSEKNTSDGSIFFVNRNAVVRDITRDVERVCTKWLAELFCISQWLVNIRKIHLRWMLIQRSWSAPRELHFRHSSLIFLFRFRRVRHCPSRVNILKRNHSMWWILEWARWWTNRTCDLFLICKRACRWWRRLIREARRSRLIRI